MRPQTVVERLDFVAKRIPGLKFTPPTQLKAGDEQGYGCFMSCDMYYIEIKVDQSHQTVKDVVISHGNNPDGISCPVLRKVLVDQDFETFAKHLTGLHSIYQISTNDKKVKQRAYPALTALETDLTILYDHQRRRTNNCHDLVHKSPIGIMEPRKGGLPVKLTYFITPYDLIDTTNKGLIQLNLNNILEKNLGLSVTVEIEGSSTHKLQVKSLISTQHNSSLPAYAPFNSQNSEKLPAQFVLKLSQPFPMSNTSIHQIINEINEPSTIKEYLTTLINNSKESLMSLIARQELDLNKGPFGRSVDVFKSTDSESCDLRKHVYSINLLDQHQTYHIFDSYLERQEGVYVTKIPFSHPTSIPNILRVLRQQALFNFVIGSCIRRNKNLQNPTIDENIIRNSSDTYIFDIIPVSLTNVCISFEHPSKESLATLEIDFKELSCQLYALDKESVCSNEYATRVLQKCWSIPITLRSVLKKCNERRLALLEDASKRRERELQELLTNNSAQQAPIHNKPHLQYQENLLQAKFNSLNEKSTSKDLNSIVEFLNSKISTASTSDVSNQTGTDNASNRSNLLKKFSCKPKVKQSTATKNQTGNKILSLMLKRDNSSSSSLDDASLKATSTKKLKKNQGESSLKGSSGLTTTKLISTEVANASRLAHKQAKQNANHSNASFSLIKSPIKAQQASSLASSATTVVPVNVSLTNNVGGLTSNLKHNIDANLFNNTNANNLKIKNSSINNNNNNVSKPRKSSIGAVLDSLVGGVTPDQNSTLNQYAQSHDSNPSDNSTRNVDSIKGSPAGAKSKSRTPADQFAIKQGTVGSLKLTVTKTKPAAASSSVSTSSTSQPSAPSTSFSSSSSSLPGSTNNSKTAEISKILNLGSSTPTTKYTIPKISKTQQASQSTNQSNPTENQNATANDSTSHGDESTNPSSSANLSSAPSSTTTKRTTSTPFNRTNNSNRNPVSSSTHPLVRTTSNLIANANRPSSTSTNDNHLLNRISSSNQNPQNMRQQMNNRILNLQQQQLAQRHLNQAVNNVQHQQPPTPMFAMGLTQQPSAIFHNTPDINILAANQAALLNQQRSQNTLNPIQQIPAPMFMSSSLDANLISSSRPNFAQQQQLQQPISGVPTSNGNVCDSLQRPSTSVINASPQFYVRQPMFEENFNTVSSTPRPINEASQSSFIDQRRTIEIAPQQPPTTGVASLIPSHTRTNEGTPLSNNNTSSTVNTNIDTSSSTQVTRQPLVTAANPSVSSSSDTGNQEIAPTISTPSSPTECGHAETVPPPPLIPIDSLDEPNAISPDTDHPDDASDRLSIVDTNENMADCNSVAGTPKTCSVQSPTTVQDSNVAIPSSSSKTMDISASNSAAISVSESSSNATPTNEPLNHIQSPVGSTAALTSNTFVPPESAGLEERSVLAPSSSSSATPVAANEGSSSSSQVKPTQSSNNELVAVSDNDQIVPQSTMTATTSEP